MNHFGPLLDSIGITNDLQAIINSIEDETKRKEDLDESQLSQLAKQVVYSTETLSQLIPEAYFKLVEGLKARAPQEWV